MAEQQGTTIGECYRYNRDTRDFVEAVEARHDREFKEVRDDVRALVDMLRNRLPIWATLYISFLMLLVGGLIAKVAFT